MLTCFVATLLFVPKGAHSSQGPAGIRFKHSVLIGCRMEASKQKVVQYLNEAHASRSALVRVLQSQIAMTPRGTYRTGLETM